MVSKAIAISIIAVLTACTAVLDFIGVVAVPVAFWGVSGFYIGAAFFTAFGFWFGMWGLVSIYFGLILGAMLTGTFGIHVFALSLGNVLGAALPMYTFKKFKLDISLRGKKELLIYVLATVGQDLISGILTLGGFVLIGFMPVEIFSTALIAWLIGDQIVSIVIGIPLISSVTPFVTKTPAYVEKFWN